MKRIFKIISNKHFLPLLLVLFFAVLAGRSLIFQSGYFNMHDDLQMMRQLQMEKCLLDGQIPCRWVPDMGYGFGFPLFNFYPPLPYLIGEAFRIFGTSFVTAVKLTFALSLIISGITMYLLAKEFFGRIGAVLSSVFYIWAPYRAVDVYVRGAMNESWAFAWLPLICWASLKLIRSEKKGEIKWIMTLALAWFALLASHNLMVIIFAPVFIGWIFIHLWCEGKWNKIPKLLISGFWAFGLTAFSTLPALFENQLTHITSALKGYFQFHVHFASLNQLFLSRFWGYDGSEWGIENDGMSFAIGKLHWISSFFVAVLVSIKLFAKRKLGFVDKLKQDGLSLITYYFLLVGWFSAFLIHSKSTFIWFAIPQLAYVQFPWRFLSIVVFAFSFVIGVIPGVIAKWKSKHGLLTKLVVTPPQFVVSLMLILGLILLNWNYFRPKGGAMGPLTDEEKFSGEAWRLQKKAGIMDYLPLTVKQEPNSPQSELAEVIEGEAEIIKPEQGTYWALFDIDVESESAEVRINIFDFPNWRVFVENNEVEVFISEDEEWGRIHVEISQGEHRVYAQLFNTPVRTVGNTISLASWLILFSYPLWRKRRS